MAAVMAAATATAATANEPEWIEVKPVRKLARWTLGNVLGDIESRMRQGHGYAFPATPMTWAHETTHGLQSEIRMRERIPGRRINAVYVPGGRAAIVVEPRRCKISDVARRIPASLRGPSYDLYIVRQAKYWNDTPTYVLDEWAAYCNGSDCAEELGKKAGEFDWHYEVLQACNFTVYSLAMAKTVSETEPDYDHRQLRAIIDFQASRCVGLLRRLRERRETGRNLIAAEQYLQTFLESETCSELREFAEEYLGSERFKEIFGK